MKLDDLKPDPHNANRGTPRGHGVIEQSIRRHGAGRSGLAANDGTMIAGSQTLEEMAALGMKIKPVHTTGDEWVVVIRDDVEPGSEQAKLMALEDNRASQLGLEWEPDVLAELAGEIDLSGLFFPDELADLALPIEPGAGGDEFDVEPSDGPTRAKVGDLWAIGPHRLIVGDCTDGAVVERLMGGERADMAFLDPPYGIGYDSNHAGLDGTPNPHAALANDSEVDTGLIALLPDCIHGPVYLCTRWDVAPQWIAALLLMGLTVKNQIVWVKSNHGMGDLTGAYGSKWEAILFAHDGSFTFPNERPIDVWDLGQIFTSGYRNHPTEKTVKVPEKAIVDSTKPNDLVIDFFAGSGTTLIAAHRTGRRCYGAEISPKYADVILRRATAEGLECSLVDD